MNAKRIGALEITTSQDSEWVTLRYWCNDSISQEMQLRSNEDLLDLRYALECVMNEQSRRIAQRRGAGHE